MSSIQTPLSQKRVQFNMPNRQPISTSGGRTPVSSLSLSTTDRLAQPSPVANKMPRLTASSTPTPSGKSSSTTSISTSHTSTLSSSDSNAIMVGIRVRPLCAKERAAGFHEATFVDPESNHTQLWVTDKSSKKIKFGGDFVITDQTSPNLPVAGVDGIVDPNIIGNFINSISNNERLFINYLV